jgi:hypothetical protein
MKQVIAILTLTLVAALGPGVVRVDGEKPQCTSPP